ncbi:unnamed protein product [Sphagnum balticum]
MNGSVNGMSGSVNGMNGSINGNPSSLMCGDMLRSMKSQFESMYSILEDQYSQSHGRSNGVTDDNMLQFLLLQNYQIIQQQQMMLCMQQNKQQQLMANNVQQQQPISPSSFERNLSYTCLSDSQSRRSPHMNEMSMNRHGHGDHGHHDAMSQMNLEIAPTLNNQVVPGSRANNYWDNFKSFSRQNKLSPSSSNSNSNATFIQNANNKRNDHVLTNNHHQNHHNLMGSSVHSIQSTNSSGTSEREMGLDMTFQSAISLHHHLTLHAQHNLNQPILVHIIL